VTSYKELRREALACERWNRLNPGEKPHVPYVTDVFARAPGVFVAASDYVTTLPDSISKWLPRSLQTLGTDGFGRSDSRPALRDFFEVDARYVVLATLYALAKEKQVSVKVVTQALKDLGLNPEKLDPLTA
jgi:pyruvate dehydrogenase E1 component